MHSGEMAKITIEPAPEDYGIKFCRTDIQSQPEIPALGSFVVATDFCTVLGKNGVTVMTVEHLLSALAGMGVDNARICLEGPEVPIMDGSASSFVFLLQASGLKCLSKPKKIIQLNQAVRVEQEGRYIEVRPASYFHITIEHEIAYRNETKVLEAKYDDNPHEYVRAVSRARTFGWLKQYEVMLKNKMSKGSCLNNAVLFSDHGVVNEGGLRYKDEPCRHKILDAVGDLSLAGAKILGHVYGRNTGHKLNVALVAKLMASDAWSYVDREKVLP